MIQASAEAARLEGRLGEAQTADGLWPLLRHWHEAAAALDQAVARARAPLEQEGTPKDQIDRIRRRLSFLEQKSKLFDLEVDLDECVQSWNGLGLELAQLSGKQRDALVQVLQERKPAIDRTTTMLSEALRHEGLLQEDLRKRTGLREERDRARARHERLRQAWLAGQRDWEAAQRQHVPAPGAQQHEVKKPPVLDLRQGSQHGTSPVIVRLPLDRLLERGHHRMGAVAARVQKTLSHLATAEHRTLTDPTAGELRAHLARMDSVLARLSGQRGDELRDGAREVSTLLHRMSAIATRAGASAHVAPFRKLMEERKGQLRRLAQDSGGKPRQAALWPPPVLDPGHPLRELRGSNPGLDRLLRQSSQAQLAAELSKQSRAGLQSIPATPVPRAASFAAANLAGFGGAHPTGLGALAGEGGALANALEKEMGHQRRREEPRETGEFLAGLRPAPERTALRELARGAELKEKQLATRLVRKGPSPSQITGAVLLGAAREHPKGRAFAEHLAPGGPLRALCETVQRGHGLPIGQAAQHYLASRGSSHLWNAVATFNALAKEGYTPRFSLGSWLGKNVSDPASHALRSLPGTAGQGALAAASLGAGAREGISSLGQRARGAVLDVAGGAGQAVRQTGRTLKDAANFGAQSTWGQIGALQAISDGKDWKAVLASAAGGAITGAIPFLKAGPLAKLGVGALQGGITALASGGSLKDALKGGGGALDAFDPGAFHALKKLKTFSAAEKLLRGRKLPKHAGPLRNLEKALSNPRARRVIGALERAGSKGVESGIWVSGKAARAQHALDRAVSAGEQVHGALEHLAQLELEDHRRKHPELQLAEATGMRTRRVRGEEQLLGRQRPRTEAFGLEKAIERGRELMTKGRRVPQGAHDKLGKVHDVVEQGLAGAGRVQSGLEKAIELARQGAGIFGEDSDLGQSLIHAADRADQIHDHLEIGIDAAQKFNQKVGATHDLLEKIPGVEERFEQVSGFGIQKSTHRDIFENTRAIYAVRTKVQSFAGALHDPDAIGQVGKALIEARKAKSALQALKAKYRKDKAAHEFLTGGGSQDKLIDEVLQRLAAAEKAARPKIAKVAGVAEQVSEMLGEDSPLGQLAQQLGDGAGRGQGKLHEVLDLAGKGKKFLDRGEEVFQRVLELAAGHYAKEIGKDAVHELREAPHQGWDRTAEDVLVLESVNRLPGTRAQPDAADRDAPPRMETDGGLTTAISGDRGREQHDPFSDLLDDMFAGGDARIHVDRGGARLDLDELDLQDVDPAAMDTWIGSGEAVKSFSEVFGAFIPAEAAIVVRVGGGHGQEKGSEPGEPTRRRQRRRRKQRGGFFARLFDRLEGFADRIGGWAKKGSRLLGKGMDFAELGMHGLSQIEGAAERVQGFAGKSEGFLERMGLHQLAGYAGQMGAAAFGVDEEA